MNKQILENRLRFCSLSYYAGNQLASEVTCVTSPALKSEIKITNLYSSFLTATIKNYLPQTGHKK
jgi:hypothetical protein